MLPLLYFVIALIIGLFSNFCLTLSLFPCILRRLFTSSVFWISKQFPHLGSWNLGKKQKSLKKHAQKLNWFGWRNNMSRIPSCCHLPHSVMGRVHAHNPGGAGSRPKREVIFPFFWTVMIWLKFFWILIGMNWYRLKKKASLRQEPMTLQIKSKQVTTTPHPNSINFWFIS